MDANRGKVFITTINNIVAAFIIIAVGACDNDYTDPPIPPASFSDIFINLSLPQYQDLSHDQGYIIIGDKGVRGIIVYRENVSTYYAYEQNCSYEPNEACANVDVHSSNLYMYDPCCGSNFSFDQGVPTSGPARSPLRMYSTNLNGNNLTITDLVIN